MERAREVRLQQVFLGLGEQSNRSCTDDQAPRTADLVKLDSEILAAASQKQARLLAAKHQRAQEEEARREALRKAEEEADLWKKRAEEEAALERTQEEHRQAAQALALLEKAREEAEESVRAMEAVKAKEEQETEETRQAIRALELLHVAHQEASASAEALQVAKDAADKKSAELNAKVEEHRRAQESERKAKEDAADKEKDEQARMEREVMEEKKPQDRDVDPIGGSKAKERDSGEACRTAANLTVEGVSETEDITHIDESSMPAEGSRKSQNSSEAKAKYAAADGQLERDAALSTAGVEKPVVTPPTKRANTPATRLLDGGTKGKDRMPYKEINESNEKSLATMEGKILMKNFCALWNAYLLLRQIVRHSSLTC